MLNQEQPDLSISKRQLQQTPDHFAILSGQVQDIEEFSQAFQGFALVMTQLSPGQCRGTFLAIRIGDWQLLRVTVNCAVHTTGTRLPGGIGFCTPLSPLSGELVNHKTPLPYQSLFGLDCTRTADLISPQAFDLTLVVTSTIRFQEYLHALERDDIDEAIFRLNHIQITDEAHSTFQAYLQQIFHLAVTNPKLLKQSQTLVQRDLLPLIVNCFDPEVNDRLRVYPFRRSVIVQQAEDFIVANLDQPLTLQDLCEAVKVSKSALSYGFQEIFGMSPMAYLKIRRLNSVRHVLQASCSETDTVLGIANRFGFWHMGHFSRDYKQLFGESPSETLKR